MQVTVQAFSDKYEPSIKFNDQWHVTDRKHAVDLEGFNTGDVVEVDVNKKWISAIKLVTKGDPNAAAPAQSSSHRSQGSSGGIDQTERQHQINRSAVTKSMLEGSMMGKLLEDRSLTEATQEVKNIIPSFVRYVETGKFEEAEEAK